MNIVWDDDQCQSLQLHGLSACNTDDKACTQTTLMKSDARFGWTVCNHIPYDNKQMYLATVSCICTRSCDCSVDRHFLIRSLFQPGRCIPRINIALRLLSSSSVMAGLRKPQKLRGCWLGCTAVNFQPYRNRLLGFAIHEVIEFDPTTQAEFGRVKNVWLWYSKYTCHSNRCQVLGPCVKNIGLASTWSLCMTSSSWVNAQVAAIELERLITRINNCCSNASQGSMQHDFNEMAIQACGLLSITITSSTKATIRTISICTFTAYRRQNSHSRETTATIPLTSFHYCIM